MLPLNISNLLQNDIFLSGKLKNANCRQDERNAVSGKSEVAQFTVRLMTSFNVAASPQIRKIA